jgi:uncharacterized protein (DUF433 family)
VEVKPTFDRITIEPGKMNGQPCIRGLRITVRRVLEALGAEEARGEFVVPRSSNDARPRYGCGRTDWSP